MKKQFVPLFLVVTLSLIVFGCKKDKEDETLPENTELEWRTTVYSLTISGDFEGEYEASQVSTEGVNGGVVGGYDVDMDEFNLAMIFSELPNNGFLGLYLYAGMSALSPGNYALDDVDFATSEFVFSNDSTTVTYTVDSGSLTITNVELKFLYSIGYSSVHYIDGNFTLTMSNDENETAVAQGQFVNGWVLSN